MSAHRSITAQKSVRETASELVALFMPEATGDQKALRTRIHIARDTARSRAGSASSFEGRRLYAEASQIAGEWVFRRGIGCEELSEVIKVISWIFLVATTLERLEGDNG